MRKFKFMLLGQEGDSSHCIGFVTKSFSSVHDKYFIYEDKITSSEFEMFRRKLGAYGGDFWYHSPEGRDCGWQAKLTGEFVTEDCFNGFKSRMEGLNIDECTESFLGTIATPVVLREFLKNEADVRANMALSFVSMDQINASLTCGAEGPAVSLGLKEYDITRRRINVCTSKMSTGRMPKPAKPGCEIKSDYVESLLTNWSKLKNKAYHEAIAILVTDLLKEISNLLKLAETNSRYSIDNKNLSKLGEKLYPWGKDSIADFESVMDLFYLLDYLATCQKDRNYKPKSSEDMEVFCHDWIKRVGAKEALPFSAREQSILDNFNYREAAASRSTETSGAGAGAGAGAGSGSSTDTDTASGPVTDAVLGSAGDIESLAGSVKEGIGLGSSSSNTPDLTDADDAGNNKGPYRTVASLAKYYAGIRELAFDPVKIAAARASHRACTPDDFL